MNARTHRVPAAACCLFVLAGLGLGCSPKQEGATELPADNGQLDATDAAKQSNSEPAPTLGLRNARQPSPNLLTGGQPTSEVLERAALAGYRTIIDLRAVDEDRGFDEPAEVERLNMAYVPIPIDGISALTEANAGVLAEALADAEQPVLLHCGSGNRVGALLALKAFYLDGLDSQSALEEGRAAGMTTLTGAIEELLAPRSP